MNQSNGRHNLLFPCECVSARPENYSDPWAAIARNKLLPAGTKEEILNLVSNGPKTISQLAKALNLAVPSVHKHVNELVSSELMRDSAEWEKLHPKERYYEPNFPIVRASECAEIEATCRELSEAIAKLFEEARPKFERAFQSSGLPKNGWTFDDLSQCAFARIQRGAREILEERGLVRPAQTHGNGVTWSFWAEQVEE
jgi:DNA-binding transcriptional ArsR family regulator